ncbi:MAG TPA: thioredoxin family protein, partial [Candidatus Binataceae bacterium]|nr:thioredoxin family protein [Candidatus Binataceae bacterium]
TRAGRNWRPFLILRSAIGVGAVAALGWLLVSSSAPAQLTFSAYDPALIASATEDHKPLLLDFRADWCIPCREMDHSTFADPSVVKAAKDFVRLRADLTKQDDVNDAIISKFRIQGVPTTLIIDGDGHEKVRKVGYVGAQEMLADLRSVDGSSKPQ